MTKLMQVQIHRDKLICAACALLITSMYLTYHFENPIYQDGAFNILVDLFRPIRLANRIFTTIISFFSTTCLAILLATTITLLFWDKNRTTEILLVGLSSGILSCTTNAFLAVSYESKTLGFCSILISIAIGIIVVLEYVGCYEVHARKVRQIVKRHQKSSRQAANFSKSSSVQSSLQDSLKSSLQSPSLEHEISSFEASISTNVGQEQEKPSFFRRSAPSPPLRSDQFQSRRDSNTSNTSRSRDSPSLRQLTAIELLQTEQSYVRNLVSIQKFFIEPIESSLKTDNPIISKHELDIITGNIINIIKLHEKLLQHLDDAISEFDEKKTCIGKIIKESCVDMKIHYPKYVNYFDIAKDKLSQCRESKVEFKEMLDGFYLTEGCNKQPLEALLIRPVQRLPSISLLVNDLIKRTCKDHRDYRFLIEAKESIKDVLTHINEDKRKSDSKIKIFDIVSRVENAPVILVSANRSYVHRIDCQCKVEGTFTSRLGDRMALFLFNDCIEIARWKRETSADMVENEKTGKNAGSLGRHQGLKRDNVKSGDGFEGRMLFKHYKLLPLNSIKRVVTVTPEDSDAAGSSSEQMANTLWCLDIDPEQPSLEHSKVNSLSPRSISSTRHNSSSNLLKNGGEKGSDSPKSARSRPTSLQNTPEIEDYTVQSKHNTLTVFQTNDQKSRDHWLSLLKFTLENLPENEEDSSYVNDELMRDMSYNQLPNSRFGLSFIKQMIKPPKMFKK